MVSHQSLGLHIKILPVFPSLELSVRYSRTHAELPMTVKLITAIAVLSSTYSKISPFHRLHASLTFPFPDLKILVSYKPTTTGLPHIYIT